MTQEIITLYVPGALPGIPGESYGPGTFLVDYDARTIEALDNSEVAEEQSEILAGTETTEGD